MDDGWMGLLAKSYRIKPTVSCSRVECDFFTGLPQQMWTQQIDFVGRGEVLLL